MKNLSVILFLAYGFVALAQDTYSLSEQSAMNIDGTSTIHDWSVVANSMSGEVEAEGTTLKEIRFEVDVENIKSERGPTMDNKIYAALKKEEYPKVIFNLSKVKGQSVLEGALTIAGQEKTIEIPVKMSSSEGNIKLVGEQKITLQDYGIEPPTAMFGQIIVGDDVTVKFDLVFVKS